MKLYTRNNCSACKNVKTALKAKGQPFEELNIQEDHHAALTLVNQGFRAVPVLQIEDGTFLQGEALYSFVR